MTISGSIRTFIAIQLPAEIQNGLAKVESELKPLIGTAVRWVPPENIHITLKFLGDTPLQKTKQVQEIIRHTAEFFQPFTISVGQIGAFPNIQRPRVLWVGLQTGPELAKLQAIIDQETARIGFASENRAFSPHLTIGRVNQTNPSAELSNITACVKNYPPITLGSFSAQSVAHIRSDLRPSGAVYTILSEAPLIKK